MRAIDLRHRGNEKVICCWELQDGVLVDPGPQSTEEALLAALGARHMASPERLVASAARLYGGEDELARLWGEVVPVPERNLEVMRGGETVLGSFRVEYTPGHASHHVSFLHEPSGTAFVGDVAGVRI